MQRIFLYLLFFYTSSALSQVHEYLLDNGLKLVVKEDHRAPIAVCMVWYNIGSGDEVPGHTGLTHALEHLMFKGTPHHPVGDYSKLVAAQGGQENAFTTADYTAYFIKIASDRLNTCFDLESDRMRNLKLSPEEFTKEIKVIQEERRMRTDNNPQSLTYERFLATAHLSAPYHHPVIGWMSDLEQMTVDNVLWWYKKYYSPNNATLVVVGDVNPEEVFHQANHYFAALTTSNIPKRKSFMEPSALGKKTIEVHAPAQIPMIVLGYTVPSVKSDPSAMEPYALDVIAAILSAGESARFTKNLIRGQQIASNVDIYYNLYSRYQSQFVIFGIPARDKTLKAVIEGIKGQLKLLQTQPVSVEELQRIKNQIIAQKTFEKDSIFDQAMELGLLETIGVGWQKGESYSEKIKKITPEQVQEAAKKYFNDVSLTEAYLIPENPEGGQHD